MSAVIESDLQQGTLAIRPLQPTIGAEIEGVDLRYPLGDATRDQIKAAILEYKVVFFRDQELDRDQHGAFARQFGPLYTHPSVSKSYADKVPAIHQISAVDAKTHEKSATGSGRHRTPGRELGPLSQRHELAARPHLGRGAPCGHAAGGRRRHDLG